MKLHLRQFLFASAAILLCATTLPAAAQPALSVKVNKASGQGASSPLLRKLAASPKLAGYAACVIPQAGVALAPASVNFGTVNTGSSSSPQNVSLTNTGNQVLNIASIIAATNSGLDTNSNFSRAGTCGSSLMPGTSCTIAVTFNANDSVSPITGSLKVFSNAPGSPHSVPLNALVNTVPVPKPIIAISPAGTTNFSARNIGSTSPATTFTVSNSGTAGLVISSVYEESADFAVVSDGCGGTTVAPAGTCQFGVTFTPNAIGVKEHSITVVHNAAPFSTSTSRTVTGLGLNPSGLLVADPSSVYVDVEANTTSDPFDVTVKNLGATAVNIAEVEIGSGGSTFIITGQNCIGPLAPLAVCTVTMTASVSGPDGYSGNLEIRNNLEALVLDVPLYANAFTPPPSLSLSPSSEDFGIVDVGSTSAIRNFTVTNSSSTETYEISFGSYYGESYFYFYETPTSGTPCGAAISPLSSCTIGVSFSPQSEGYAEDYLVVEDLGSGTQYYSYVQGEGHEPGPRVEGSPTYRAFGAQVIGSTTTQTFTITNVGTSGPLTTLDISGVSVSGASVFSVTTDCNGASLAPSASCTATVTFQPTGTESYYADLIVFSNALNTGEYYMSMDGEGVAGPTPSVDYLPMSLSFTAQPLCSTSAGKTVSLANTGSAPLTISSIVSSGEFTVTHDCPVSPSTMAPNSCCTMAVTYTPQSMGSGEGSLQVYHDAGGETTIPLNGVSDGAKVCVNPVQLIFPDQIDGTVSAPLNVAITNPAGSPPVNVNNITTTGNFRVVPSAAPPMEGSPAPKSKLAKAAALPPSCVGTIGPGTTCSLPVTFEPTGGPGPRTGMLSIITAIGTPKLVPLSGNALPSTVPGISFSADSVTFPGQIINTTSTVQTVSITSSGTEALLISGVSASGPFAATSNCPASLAVGATCQMQITFTPTAVGVATGAVTVATNIADSVSRVVLSGEGLPLPAPILHLSANGISYGTLAPGAQSVIGIVVSNRGNAPLLIQGMTISGPFELINRCPASLAAGGSCTVDARYRAQGLGGQAGALTILTNDSRGPANISLTGKTCLLFSPRAARFGLPAC